MTDEELQDKTEIGQHQTGTDGRLYQRLFDALRHEPEFPLPSNFTDSVLARIILRPSESTLADLVWLGLGIGAFAIAALVAVLLTNFRFDAKWFQFGNYTGVVVFGILFVIVLQWIDKRMVRPGKSEGTDSRFV